MPAWVRLKPDTTCDLMWGWLKPEDTTYDLVWAGESRTLVQRRDLRDGFMKTDLRRSYTDAGWLRGCVRGSRPGRDPLALPRRLPPPPATRP